MRFDLTIAHRVCPALSKTVVGYSDKRTLVADVAATLETALAGLRVRLVVILDGCSCYREIFEKAFASRKEDEGLALEFVEMSSVGNKATWAKQVEILSAAETDIVYFSEDDYLYDEEAFKAMLEFIRQDGVDMISPIDHPDRYNGKCEIPYPAKVRTSPVRHWRSVGTTCLTFMARKDVLVRSADVMLSYSRCGEEGTMWLGLTKERVFDVPYLIVTLMKFLFRRPVPFGQIMPVCAWKQQGLKLLTHPRFTLWSPMPTLAVHLSTASLSLGSERFFPIACREELRRVALAYLGTCRLNG